MHTSLPYYNEQELLSDIASGNAQAFRILFSRYQQQVYAFSKKITRSAYEAEEITQEVFLKIWLNREQMAGIDNPEAWIITMTRNLCFNYLKKLAAEKSRVALSFEKSEKEVVPVNQQLEIKELVLKLRQVSSQLTPREQLIYRMSKENGMRKKEIADSLQISENTVKVHLTNALRKLRQLMERYATAGLLLFFFFRKLF